MQYPHFYFKKLADKAEIYIQAAEVDWIEWTLMAKIYPPCHDFDRLEPLNRTPENILRIVHIKTLLKDIEKWKKSGQLWHYQGPNQRGLKVRISVEVAIILFELCEASNNKELNILKGNIQTHLAKNFNLFLGDMKRESTPDNEEDYLWYFED